MGKLLAALAACLLLAGCTGSETDDDATPGAGDGATANALPDPLHWGEAVMAGADPFNYLPVDPNDPTSLAGPGACSQDVSSCTYYDFSVNASAAMTATLAWSVQANDLDLYLYQGDTLVSQDGINSVDPTNPASLSPATSQVMHVDVAPGLYTFWVVVWDGAADSYTLDATFA